MGEVVNLRLRRKQARRAAHEAQAEANRVAFGTPKALKDLAKARREAEARQLDGHRLGANEGPGPDERS